MSLARLLKKIESYYPNFDRELVERAYFYAEKAHAGQFRNSGEAFIQHPLEVACILADLQLDILSIAAGLLHDVVEDTDVTFDYLESQGFSKEVLDALDALTRRDNEPYEDFIKRVAENKVACYVKLSDLRDNMDLSRIPNPTQKDHQRVEKYRKAVGRILEALDSYSESSQE